MKIYSYIQWKLKSAVLLIVILSSATHAQSTRPAQNQVFLEIEYTYCDVDCDSFHETTQIFTFGRYVTEGVYAEKSASGRLRKVTFRREKQLESDETAELMKWLEQADFQNAKPEYTFIAFENPSWIIITYRNKGMVKSVRVSNFSQATPAQRSSVPQGVVKLARWAHPYAFSE